jgi:hypothetical protein
MSRFTVVLPGLTVLSICLCQPALAAAAASGPNNCNQLGREIALRAAEQLEVPLDAQARTELAALAEAACLEGEAVAPAEARVEESTGVVAEPAEPETDTEAGRASRLFDIEVIDPADRVQRPGLKRR